MLTLNEEFLLNILLILSLKHKNFKRQHPLLKYKQVLLEGHLQLLLCGLTV